MPCPRRHSSVSMAERLVAPAVDRHHARPVGYVPEGADKRYACRDKAGVFPQVMLEQCSREHGAELAEGAQLQGLHGTPQLLSRKPLRVRSQFWAYLSTLPFRA